MALVAIGVVAGGCTGLIENAAKTGWLKVTAGLIAGKQFILYRNPTFIGSGPECQIYLFRDPKVGRRHAAVHLVPGGIELEKPAAGRDHTGERQAGRTREIAARRYGADRRHRFFVSREERSVASTMTVEVNSHGR